MSELNVLPQGWVVKPLGESSETVKGKKPKNSGPSSAERAVPYINIKAFETGQPEEFAAPGNYPICERQHVLIVWDGARAGLTGRGVRGYIGSTLARVHSEFTHDSYLYYFLKSQFNYINSKTKGVGIPHVDPMIFDEIPFPIAPLNEQSRIVAEIEKQFSRLDDAVANLKRIKANLKRYKAAVLKAAVEGKLTEDWRKEHPNVEPASKLLARILTERRTKWTGKGKYKEPSQFQEGDGPDLPANWTWASLDSIANVIDPNPSHRMPKYVDNGVPLISSENFIEPDGIDFTIGKTVHEKTLQEQKNRFSVREGDFILSRIGTIGKTRFLPISQTYCLSHTMVIIQGLTSDIDRKYLRYLVASDATIKQAKLGVQSVGVPDLGMAKIRAFRIPLTCTEEQKKIVAEVEHRLSVIDEFETTVKTNLTRAARLRQSVLEKAFSGQLIPEDPNAELASILLSRTHAENEADLGKMTPRQGKSEIRGKGAVMTDLIEALKSVGDWTAAQDAFRLCNVTDGADTNEVERVYAELRECINLGQIEVERRGEQDWLRLVESKGG